MPHIGSPAVCCSAVATRVPTAPSRHRRLRWLSHCILAGLLLTTVLGVAACAVRTAHPPELLAAFGASEWQSEPGPRSVAQFAADEAPVADTSARHELPICGGAESSSPSSYGELGAVGPFFLAGPTRSTHGGPSGKLRIHAADVGVGATGAGSVRSRSPPLLTSG